MFKCHNPNYQSVDRATHLSGIDDTLAARGQRVPATSNFRSECAFDSVSSKVTLHRDTGCIGRFVPVSVIFDTLCYRK